MKLRIRGNSVRLRLTKSEIVEAIGAHFEANCLSISVPKTEAENWINSDQVGIENTQPLGPNRSLRILIEKDSACLTERIDEDETDVFPNALANSK